MGGGLMQLVAYGAQDVYLTGNPQITFFKVVYRRHTNFSMEAIEQVMSGNVALGNRVTSTISRNGDLVGKMYLQASVNFAAGVANVGTAIIQDVAVEIGGQEIDKHTGQWMEAWTQLTVPNLLERSPLIGVAGAITANTNGTTYQLATGTGGVRGAAIGASNIIHVPLQFWFNRNPGLALPLIALQYHEVKIILNFRAAALAGAGVGNTLVPNNTKLWADYIYLDTDERRRFAQVSHEYLIEQVQTQALGGVAVGSYTMNFNHPVKELVICGGGGNAAATTGPSTSQTLKNAAAASENTTLIGLKLNGHDRFAPRPLSYFTRNQVSDYHSGTGGTLMPNNVNVIADSIAVYSFALKPEEHQPSGTCNFSRIDNAQIVVSGPQGLLAGSTPQVFAVNYNVLRIMSGMGGLAYSN